MGFEPWYSSSADHKSCPTLASLKSLTRISTTTTNLLFFDFRRPFVVAAARWGRRRRRRTRRWRARTGRRTAAGAASVVVVVAVDELLLLLQSVEILRVVRLHRLLADRSVPATQRLVLLKKNDAKRFTLWIFLSLADATKANKTRARQT